MNIKILSDSTCDLSPALLAENGIDLVPLTVIKAGAQFKDGVTIRPAEIFAHVANGGALCSTAANSIGEYADYFDRYAADYDGIILINIGSGFSSCYQNACAAAADYPNVRVIDSMNLSTGQGLVVLKACELAKTASSLDALAEELRAFTSRVEASFLLDRLDYMKKGGRCSAVTALGANLLKLHPCIEVIDGKMSVTKKYRGSIEKVVADYVRERLEGRDDIDTSRIIIVDTCEDDHLASIARKYVEEDGRFAEVLEAKAGCTIFSHCGPNTLGLLFARK